MSSGLTSSQLQQWDESKQGGIIASLAIIVSLGNLSMALRFAAQLRTHQRLFAEDYLISFAVICSDIVVALLLVAVRHGLGFHVWRVTGTDPNPPRNLVLMFRYVWITAILNGPCFLSIKLSLLFFYRRIFLINQKKLRFLWWGNLIYAVLWGFGSTFSFIFQCVPVHYYWDRTYLGFPDPPPGISGECHASANWQVALPIVFSVIFDFSLLGLPLFTLWGLNMDKKRKLALVAIFSLGLIACFLEVARVLVILLGTNVSKDPSYNTVSFLVVTSAAEGAAIICACLPLIAAQARHMSQALKAYWHSRTSRNPNVAHLSRFTDHPIRLSSREARLDDDREAALGYTFQERIPAGTSTLIEASADRDSWKGPTAEEGIRVKTDVELVDGFRCQGSRPDF